MVFNSSNIVCDRYDWYSSSGDYLCYSRKLPENGESFTTYNSDDTVYGGVVCTVWGIYRVNPTSGTPYMDCTYISTSDVPVPLMIQWGKYGTINITKSKGIPVTIVLAVAFTNTMLWGQYMPHITSGHVYYHFDGSSNCIQDACMIPYLKNTTSSTCSIKQLLYCCIGF